MDISLRSLLKMTKEKKIDVKIGSKDMVFWRDIIESTRKDIEAHENMLKFSICILEMAKAKYQEEDKKFKEL